MTIWTKGVPTEDGLYVFRILNHNIDEIYLSLVECWDGKWRFKDTHARWVIPECELMEWIRLPAVPKTDTGNASMDFMLTERELKKYKQ